MPTNPTAPCKVRGCAGNAKANGAARGLCPKCYQQDRRGRLGETKAIARPGEGDEIDFRIPRPEKERVERVAARLGLTTADLCRRAVRELLGKIDPPEQAELFKRKGVRS